jgi:membrane protease YdiL (CAAX protease family)
VGLPTGRRRRVRAPWGFVDLVLVVLVGVMLIPAFFIPVGILTLFAGALAETGLSVSVLFSAFSIALYVAFFVALWLIVVVWRAVPWRTVGLRRVGLGLLLAMIPAGVGVLVLNVIILLPLTFFLGLGDPDTNSSQNDVLVSDGGMSLIELLWLAIPLVVLAPIVEELLFRGLLYRYLRGRVGVVAAVVISALVFAVLHVVIPPLFVMGIVLAVLAERTGSLWPGIVLHATNNGLVVLALWLAVNAT